MLKVFMFSAMFMLTAFAQAMPLPIVAPHTVPYADTEAVTNVPFNAGKPEDRLFWLSLELNAMADNNVSVSFGTDANTDGVLDREEADAVVGWDSGSWFYRNRVTATGVRAPRTDGHRRLDWTLTLTANRTAKSVNALDSEGVVFAGAIPSAMFNPEWNLMQITTRGLAEMSGIVENQTFGWGFKVILR